MYIIHVIPITRNASIGSLSYFSFKDIPIGSVVQVSIRNKEVPALVHKKEDASAIKALLRTRQYSTKNIKNPKPRNLLSSDFITAAQETAEHFATSVGSVFNSFVPTAILNSTEDHKNNTDILRKTTGSYEILTIQSTKEDRTNSYKTIIRGALARNESVFLLVPTIHSAEEFANLYKKGIEKYVYILHSSLTAKKQREVWQNILQEKHSVLIIATKGFLSIPRNDIGVFIIENEGSEAYREIARPFVDSKILVEKLAKHLQAKLVLGDTLLTSATHKSLTENDATEFERPRQRLRSGGKVIAIDMSNYTRKAKEERQQYPILSNEVEDAVKNLKNEHIFILSGRRGVASQTVCQDCGTNVLCSRCNSPMALHNHANNRIFLCHTCGEVKDAKTVCANCGGWKLKALGIGIERIEEAVKVLTKHPVLRIDNDTTKTKKKINETLESFSNAESAVLVGTTLALLHLHTKIETSIIVSLDAFLAVPNFSAEEYAFRTILTLAENTTGKVLIQTRSPANEMLQNATEGAIAKFVERELALRKKFKYPPYATFIKISITGPKEYAAKEVKKLLAVLSEYKPRVFRGFEPKFGGKYTLHTLIRFTHKWPNKELVLLLRSLPPSFTIEIT